MAIVLANVDKIVSSAATGSQVLDLDNLPSGGEQKFVATGAIASGDVVGLKADGTVEVVKETFVSQAENIGTAAEFEGSATWMISSAFDSNSNKIVIAYSDNGNADYGTAVVGTVSGDSISFGTPVVFESAYTTYTSTTFDSNTNKVIIAYRDQGNSGYGTAVVGTVSGTSISFGTPVVFESGSTYFISSTFDSNSDKVVITYRDDGNLGSGTAVVGTVSGTSISFGTPVVFNGNTDYTSATFDSSQNKVVIAYQDNTVTGNGTAVVGTVSGDTITFGNKVVFSIANEAREMSSTFDSSQNKVIITYSDVDNSYYGTAVVGTVSGNSISFGTPVVFETAYTGSLSATFDSNTNKVIIAYRDQGNSNHGTLTTGTVSGTSISFGTPVVFNSEGTTNICASFDKSQNKAAIAYRDAKNSTFKGNAVVYTAGGTGRTYNASSWLGIAKEAIADTQTGAVTLYGGVAKNLTGLTPNTKYYVNYDGTLTDTPNEGKTQGTYGEIGMALSSDKLLITSGNL